MKVVILLSQSFSVNICYDVLAHYHNKLIRN